MPAPRPAPSARRGQLVDSAPASFGKNGVS
jgi:hypothetical protein